MVIFHGKMLVHQRVDIAGSYGSNIPLDQIWYLKNVPAQDRDDHVSPLNVDLHRIYLQE